MHTNPPLLTTVTFELTTFVSNQSRVLMVNNNSNIMAQENCQQLARQENPEVLSELLTTIEKLTASMSKLQTVSMGQCVNNEIILLEIENATRKMLLEVRHVVSLNKKLKTDLEEQLEHVKRIESKVESFGKQFELLKKQYVNQHREIEQLRAQKPPISKSGCTIV